MCSLSRMRRVLGRVVRSGSGQATVEAAMLLPAFLLLMLVAVQPGIALYDRIVMEAAAAQGCRLLETLPEDRADEARDFVLRRLAAVPSVDVFHVGAWEVELSGGSQAEACSVRISHALRPLPIIGAGMGFLGIAQGGLYRQEAFREEPVRDEWVLASEHGADVSAWIARWEEAA